MHVFFQSVLFVDFLLLLIDFLLLLKTFDVALLERERSKSFPLALAAHEVRRVWHWSVKLAVLNDGLSLKAGCLSCFATPHIIIKLNHKRRFSLIGSVWHLWSVFKSLYFILIHLDSWDVSPIRKCTIKLYLPSSEEFVLRVIQLHKSAARFRWLLRRQLLVGTQFIKLLQ